MLLTPSCAMVLSMIRWVGRGGGGVCDAPNSLASRVLGLCNVTQHANISQNLAPHPCTLVPSPL